MPNPSVRNFREIMPAELAGTFYTLACLNLRSSGLEEKQMSEAKGLIPAPNINVTPLIDVLLVLLIIFMVAAPLKPHRFLTKVPSEPPPTAPPMEPNPLTLVVTIQPDRTLMLNKLTGMGTIDDLTPLT